MVVTAQSNTLGSKLCIMTACPLLMACNRLHGIREEVYPEGTHLMVLFTLNSVDVHNPDPQSDSLVWDTHRIWHPSQAPEHRQSDRHKRSRPPRTVQWSRLWDNDILDLQMVNITCRVLSRPYQPALPTIYRELGADYDERVLPSIVNEVLKSVVAQFNASQLITQREMVRCRISFCTFSPAKSGWST